MSLELAKALAKTELNDDLHMARLILLLNAHSGKSDKPMEGLTKLAKLDFLLRYPNCLSRALTSDGGSDSEANIADYERKTLESRMIRFRYGPWDHRYRRWLSLLHAKGLVDIATKGRTLLIWTTEIGKTTSARLEENEAFSLLSRRSRLIEKKFGKLSGSKLKVFIYETFPELSSMKWGEEIQL